MREMMILSLPARSRPLRVTKSKQNLSDQKTVILTTDWAPVNSQPDRNQTGF